MLLTIFFATPDGADEASAAHDNLSARLQPAKNCLRFSKLRGYPSHYFFNAQGYLKTAHTGFIELRVFKQLLKYVGEGYIEKYTLPAFLQMPEAQLDTIYGEF